MTQYLPEPWERDALLAQVAKADEWLVLCPRDSGSLTLEPDGTERCPECGWHTGDDLVAPEVLVEIEQQGWRARRTLIEIVLLVLGVGWLIAGFLLHAPSLTFLATALIALPAFIGPPRRKRSEQSRASERRCAQCHNPVDAKGHAGLSWCSHCREWTQARGHPRWLPPRPKAQATLPPSPRGGVAGKLTAPTRPPPRTHQSAPLPAVCSGCGGYTDPSTGGWCSSCSTYAHQRRKKDRALHPCSVCGTPTNSTSSECPSCEVHDGDWSHEIERNKRQIVSSFSLPPLHLGPVAMSGTKLPHARLGTSMTSTDTVLLLDRPAPWREGALVEVAIDPGLSCEERVLVAPQGPTLLVQCRGYDDSTAQPHSAGAEVRVVRATKRLRSI